MMFDFNVKKIESENWIEFFYYRSWHDDIDNREWQLGVREKVILIKQILKAIHKFMLEKRKNISVFNK